MRTRSIRTQRTYRRKEPGIMGRLKSAEESELLGKDGVLRE